MLRRLILLTTLLWLLAASPASAHEPCCCAASAAPTYQSFPSPCLAKHSPFRLTHLRTIRISSISSLPDEALSTPHSVGIRRPIDYTSCPRLPRDCDVSHVSSVPTLDR